MANLSFSLLPDVDVERISTDFLEKRFEEYGYLGLDIGKETDFDDQTVFKIDLKISKPASSKEIISALGSLHRTLRENGEDRFVYLNIHTPEDVARVGEASISEDVE